MAPSVQLIPSRNHSHARYSSSCSSYTFFIVNSPLFLLLLLFFTLPSNCLISALMHIAILVFMLFLSMLCDIRTRVISGFGGMGDRFDPKVPPRKNKKVGVRRFYFLHLPAVSNISVMQMRSSEPVGSTASARD